VGEKGNATGPFAIAELSVLPTVRRVVRRTLPSMSSLVVTIIEGSATLAMVDADWRLQFTAFPLLSLRFLPNHCIAA
jgi:hypothetical protein